MGQTGRTRSWAVLLAAVTLLLSACEWRDPRGDAGRSGYNPNETAITPTSAPGLHELWRAPLAASSGTSVLMSEHRVIAGAAVFPADGTGCSGTPVVCTPSWTFASVGGGDGAVVDDFHYFDQVATDFSGHRAVGAFDADGTMGCSGTPVVCNALWWTESLPNSPWYVKPALGTDGTLFAATAGNKIGAYPTLDNSSCDAGLPVVCHPIRVFDIPDLNVGQLAVSGSTLYVTVDNDVWAFDASGAKNCSSAVPAVCTALFRTQRDTLYGADLVVAGGRIYQQTWQVAGNGSWGVEAFDAAGVANCTTDSTGTVCHPVWEGHLNSPSVRTSEQSTIAVTPHAVYATVLYGFNPVTSYVYAWDPTGSANCGPVVPMVCYPFYRAVGVQDPVAAGDVLVAAASTTQELQVFPGAGVAECTTILTACPSRAALSVAPSVAPFQPGITDGRIAVHTTDVATGTGYVQVFGL